MRNLKIFLIILVVTILGGGYFLFFNKKDNAFKAKRKNLVVNSTSFVSGQDIPSKYTCEGDNINPNLTWENVPTETKSLLLVMDDPDAEAGVFTHWLVWNIDPKTTEIKENYSTSGVVGKNDFGSAKYEGPCPPFGKHRYFFKIYALDKLLDLEEGATVAEVEKVAQKHLLDSGELEGYYVKKLK